MQSLIKSNNQGESRLFIDYPDFLKMSDSELSTSVDAENFKMNIKNIRSKIDVVIQYEIAPGKYKSIPVSAKSVAEQHVKLVDSTNLYNILLFSKNYNFIKHYLNVITWSDDGGRASDNQIIQANRLVRGLIMQLAAQGFDINNPAELLIVHDINQKRIKVYNLKALIYLIQQQIQNGNQKYDNLIQGFYGDEYTIKQSFEDTVQNRLRVVFNEIRRKQLSAFIYGSQLQDYLNLLKKSSLTT